MSMGKSKLDRKEELESLFDRAAWRHENGNLKSAFRLSLVPAKGGNLRAQLLLGYFYSNGIGVKPNRDRALYWNRRAYRGSKAEGWDVLSGAAANNIGLILRDDGKLNQAITWLKRAVNLHDGDANLEIAKIYLDKNDPVKAIHYLKQTLTTDPTLLVENSREEAKHLLGRLGAKGLKRPKGPKEGRPTSNLSWRR
jgi:TPR repeat protein